MDFPIFYELSLYAFLTQAIGFLAFFVGVYAFTKKSDRKLRLWQAVQCFLLSLHFYLLGAQSASGVTLLAGIRNVIALHKHSKAIGIIFLFLYIVVGIVRYQTPVDILPICSAILGTIAIFYLSGIKMRIFLMAGTFLWIIHNAIVFSVGPFFMELIIFFVTAYTTYTLWKSSKNVLKIEMVDSNSNKR